MRINKYLANSGLCSRRKAEEYIVSGKVKVNGQVVTNLATDIKENDVVLVNNKQIKKEEKFVYYMLNKPKGFVTSSKDDRERKTVLDIVKSPYRVYPIGRLDYDSQGLLLLTNDGDLTFKLSHPKNNIGKTYIVDIEGEINPNQINTLKKGIVIDGYKLRESEIKLIEFKNNKSKLEVKIFEGRNREIRKMFEFINKKVVYLKRIKIGELSLDKLKRGEYRELTKKEVDYLKSL